MENQTYPLSKGYSIVIYVFATLIVLSSVIELIFIDKLSTYGILENTIMIALSIFIVFLRIRMKISYRDGEWTLSLPFFRTIRFNDDQLLKVDIFDAYTKVNSITFTFTDGDTDREVRVAGISKAAITILPNIENWKPELLGITAQEYLAKYGAKEG